MSQKTRFDLTQADIPSAWYNLNADFPEPLPPPLHPGTQQPMPPEALEAIFPKNLPSASRGGGRGGAILRGTLRGGRAAVSRRAGERTLPRDAARPEPKSVVEGE